MRLFYDVASRVDDPYLRHALSLALRGRGATAPNPLVGCVIVRDGLIVGEGYHPQAGKPHAEVFALAQAGVLATGASAYVTLEPCSHHGRTPPCSEALIAAGVSRVVIGMADPNPAAAGGAERLRDAGVDVAFAPDPAPFAQINAGWLKRLQTGRPLVVAKIAQSLDGHGAFGAGERAAITGIHGADVTRLLRRSADAVVVGASTVAADDPVLTVRAPDGGAAEHQPLRVVVSRSCLPPSDALVFSDGAAPTLLLVPDSLASAIGRLGSHVVVESYPVEDGIGGVLDALGARGLNTVLVEPGPRLLTSLWEGEHVDELVVVTAGGMAGAQAPPSYSGRPSRQGTALTHDMVPVETGIVGDVSVTVWCPRGHADGLWKP